MGQLAHLVVPEITVQALVIGQDGAYENTCPCRRKGLLPCQSYTPYLYMCLRRGLLRVHLCTYLYNRNQAT